MRKECEEVEFNHEVTCTDDRAILAFLADMFNGRPVEHIHVTVQSVGNDTIIALTCKDVNNDD